MCNREEINEDIKMKEAGDKPTGLETFAYGSVVQATAICLKENTVDPPLVWGAENYIANNFNAPAYNPQTEEGEIATRFMSMTSKEGAEGKMFHGENDHLAVFGSEVYSGGTGENYTTAPVGGMLVQASQQHGPTALGTRLVFCYTKKDTSEIIPGAILDDDGTFILGHLKTLGKIGFFDTEPQEQQIIRTDTLENKVNDLVAALVKLGLARLQ